MFKLQVDIKLVGECFFPNTGMYICMHTETNNPATRKHNVFGPIYGMGGKPITLKKHLK